MTASPPVVYIFYGEDDFGIAQEIAAMQSRLGDSTAIEMNTSRLEGAALSLAELHSIGAASPFLARRRLVILKDPLGSLKNAQQRTRFLEILESLPETTALVLQISRALDQKHWLISWARKKESRAFVRQYGLEKGTGLARWIQSQASAEGGEFTREAAELLASVSGADKRLAAQEIEKLLAYCAYSRPVEIDDVQQLTVGTNQEGPYQVFNMVDAIGHRQTATALELLHQLLRHRDAAGLFGMVVRQFRLLLLARELLNGGQGPQQIAAELNVPGFVAQKIAQQARNFDLSALETVYRHLLNVDEAIKTGRSDAETALDTLIASLAAQTPP